MRTNEIISGLREFVAVFAAVFLCFVWTPNVIAEESSDESEQTAAPDAIPAATADDANWHSLNDCSQSAVCEFWGNSYSLKFHLKTCPFAQAMNPRHVQFLKNIKEALTLGEKPCRYCLPPYELSVSCKILTGSSSSNQSDNSADKTAETAN